MEAIKKHIEELKTKKDVFALEIILINEEIKTLTKELNKLKRKETNKKYYDENFERMDYTKTKAYKLFGKRQKDLTEEERKIFNKIQTRESRERKKKQGAKR